MRSIIFPFILILVTNSSFAQNRKIEFESGNFADLKAKAKKENKIIFIDAYTTWCGPCKWMDKNIFTNDTVADYYNLNFVNAKIDMEKGEGLEIAKNYNVQCYPTYLFIDAEGKLMHRLAGSRSVEAFVEVGKTAQDPQKMFSRFANEFESKKTDPAFLAEYLEAAAGTCLDYEVIRKTYFATQKDADLVNNKNWKLIYYYSNDYNSSEFKYLLNHVEEFQKKHTIDSVNNKIKEVFTASARQYIYSDKPEEFENFKKIIAALDIKEKDAILFEINMNYHSAKKEWEKYADLAYSDGDKYFKTLSEINGVAWNIYENSTNIMALQKAESWMAEQLKNGTSAYNWYCYDTHAALLYKLKNKDAARQAANDAIKLAKQIGLSESDYQATIDLLKEIEKLK